jgi:hypothetical protein
MGRNESGGDRSARARMSVGASDCIISFGRMENIFKTFVFSASVRSASRHEPDNGGGPRAPLAAGRILLFTVSVIVAHEQ